MPSRKWSAVVRQLRAAAGRDGDGRTDGELLSRFVRGRDEDALAALVERHAPMVWGVCCRILRNPHDAEDAFQATFLVLVQKAATVLPREMMANWLYGVARQTAVRLRATAAKRGWREVQMNEMPEPAVVEAHDEELLSLLDKELSRMPARFRALIVLCDLEGLTRKEAARQLGCLEGTVASGLARARAMLAKRLIRHGLAVSGGSLAATLSHSVASADVPSTLVTSTINVATLLAAGNAAGVISGPVATLTQGVLKMMFLKKIMTTAVAVLALGVAVVTGGSLVMGQTEQPVKPKVGLDVKPPVEKPVEPAAKQEKDKEEHTAWGKEVGGLQAGLSIRPGMKKVYRHGDTITLVVRVRNVGKEAVTFEYFKQFLDMVPPIVTDADGKNIPQVRTTVFGNSVSTEVSLEPGQEIVLETRMHGASGWPCKLFPAGGEGKVKSQDRPLFVRTGKVGVQYERVIGHPLAQLHKMPDGRLNKLATGKLELEVKEAATEKPKARTPDEAIRAAKDIKLVKEFNANKSPVEFKIESIAGGVFQIPVDMWEKDYRADGFTLHPKPLPDPSQTRFVVVLNSAVIKQFNKAGITDLEKHLEGKTVRVSGTITLYESGLKGTPSQVEIVVDDLSQLDVVDYRR